MAGACSKVWNNCLRTIQAEIDAESYQKLFQPIVPLRLENETLTIQVPSQYYHHELENNYAKLLRKVITSEVGKNGQLLYNIVVDRGNDKAGPITVDLPQNQYAAVAKNKDTQFNPFNIGLNLSEQEKTAHLDPRLTFDTFLEGDCNKLARSAGIAISENPGHRSFNPLFIYGGVGLGKTHLVQAIGNGIRNNFNDECFIVYVPADSFKNQFINAVGKSKINEFHNYYSHVDILILEDVQFLSGAEKTQDLLFTIFNELHQYGKQIIMTSDCAPADMKGVHERLLTRFSQGLTADLQRPEFETRVAIINQRMAQEGIEIPADVVEYLAREIDTSIRELEGSYKNLLFRATVFKKEINMELAQSVVGSVKRQDSRKELTLDEIRKEVAAHFSLTEEKLLERTRTREVVAPRQISMYFVREMTNHTLKSIAKYYNIKDHTTVRNAIKRAEEMINDDTYGPAIRELQKKFRQYK